MTKIANSERTEPRGSSSSLNFYYVTLEHKSGVFIIEFPGETRVLGAVARRIGELFLVTGYGGSSSENIPYFKRRLSAFVSLLAISLVGIPTLAKIKTKFLHAHLQQAMAEPTDPKELAIVNAQEQYETSSAELNQLISSPPPKDADFSIIDMWVIDAQFHWETCSLSWRTAKVSSIEWRRLEYNLLELFAEIPDDLVAYSCAEYNELVKRARQFNMDVVPVPMSQMPAKSLVPRKPTPSSVPPVVPTHTRITTLAVVPPVPQVSSVPSPVVVPPSTTPSSVLPPRELLPVKPHPIYKKKTTAVSDELATAGMVFALEVMSPLHPDLATLVKTGPPQGVTPSEGSSRSSQRLRVVNGGGILLLFSFSDLIMSGSGLSAPSFTRS
ncbi:hypothetical protein EDD18DRAFT_1114438 [Armillaria luteobubalina]|uniref:Uncharacterized protein n=1 Tax=Armillaria luteobubalina TaxID=153913 RepID=A0AA39P660_9AGAR|nr:hypothetical protein EDD18DRAFT_1114438 [Armillaria luteobubalina]